MELNSNALPLFNPEAFQALVTQGVKAFLSTPEGKEILQSYTSQKQQPENVDIDGLISIFPKLKKSSIYKRTANNDFPGLCREGKKISFCVKTVREYLESLKVETKDEITSHVLTEEFIRNRRRKKRAA